MRETLEISVREASAADHAVIREITLDVFGATTYEKNIEDKYGRIAGKTWQWRKAQHLEADLSAKNGVCLVAISDAKVCGYITMLLDDDSKIGVIANLAVEKQLSNQGIGRRLLEEGKQAMRKEGMEIALSPLSKIRLDNTFILESDLLKWPLKFTMRWICENIA